MMFAILLTQHKKAWMQGSAYEEKKSYSINPSAHLLFG